MQSIYLDFYRVMGFFGDLLQAVGLASVAITLAGLMFCLQLVALILSYFGWLPWLHWPLRVLLLVTSAVLMCFSGLMLAVSWVDPGTTSQQTRAMADLWEFVAVASGYIVFVPSVLVFLLSLSWMRQWRRGLHRPTALTSPPSEADVHQASGQ